MGVPTVSIGLPVLNGAAHIRMTLDALLAQEYTDFELNICDNASTDETGQIAEEYAARDARVRGLVGEVEQGVREYLAPYGWNPEAAAQ